MEAVHPFDRRSRGFRRRHFIDDMDPQDHEDVVFELDLAARDAGHVHDAQLTRFQRAPEGSGESAGGSSDDVIERRRVRCVRFGIDLVMRCDRSVNAERHWHRLTRQVRQAVRTAETLDAHV